MSGPTALYEKGISSRGRISQWPYGLYTNIQINMVVFLDYWVILYITGLLLSVTLRDSRQSLLFQRKKRPF
jgi:hypothetical protein